MKKGMARIALHEWREVIFQSLREYRTLSELKVVLEGFGVFVSLSSIHRFLLSDLSDEYRCYLKITGRGLVRNREAASLKVKGRDASVVASGAGLQRAINSPRDLSDFLKRSI